MTTATLTRNKHIKRMNKSIPSLSFTTHKKAGLEEALEDIENEIVITIHTPKNYKMT